MSPCRDFLRKLLRDKHPLAAAIVACNRRFPAEIREDALPPPRAAVLPLLRRDASSRFLGRVALLAEEHAGPGKDGKTAWTQWALDFRVPRHRLALLPPEVLVQLARWFGLVRHRTEASRLIDRDAVMALREEVGEEGRLFALRRSALLPGARNEADAREAPEPLPLVQRIRRSGFEAVAACLSDAPFPLAERLCLIMPPDFAERFTLPASGPAGPEDAAEHWPLLRILLFKEIAPEWEPCFS